MKDKDKGEGFMHPPYKKPVGPTEKPHYVHGYKNFKSNIKSNHPSKRKVFKDGPKNRMHYDKSASPNKMGEYSPFKMKGFSGFGNASPNKYTMSKETQNKTYTGKGTAGEKFAKNYAKKFKTVKGAVSEIIPLGKAKKTVKVIKGIIN
tara:strand:+ start:1182 stop:1625 length:444 start_codon:yes stop_codon:yes gene_type:complete